MAFAQQIRQPAGAPRGRHRPHRQQTEMSRPSNVQIADEAEQRVQTVNTEVYPEPVFKALESNFYNALYWDIKNNYYDTRIVKQKQDFWQIIKNYIKLH